MGQKRIMTAEQAVEFLGMTEGQRYDVISLSGGRSVTIGWPPDITEDEAKDLSRQIDLWQERIRIAGSANTRERSPWSAVSGGGA